MMRNLWWVESWNITFHLRITLIFIGRVFIKIQIMLTHPRLGVRTIIVWPWLWFAPSSSSWRKTTIVLGPPRIKFNYNISKLNPTNSTFTNNSLDTALCRMTDLLPSVPFKVMLLAFGDVDGAYVGDGSKCCCTAIFCWLPSNTVLRELPPTN